MRTESKRRFALVVLASCLLVGLVVAFPLVGTTAVTVADNSSCGGSACHATAVTQVAASGHKGYACVQCHEGASAHQAVPSDATKYPTVHFDLDLCGAAGCHPDQFGTYTYGDDYKTKYGGSPTAWPKTNDFGHYNDIIDGHGFAKDYNEERSHDMMLRDHVDIKRGKFEVCLQCKSTKVTYYWDSGKTRTIKSAVTVTSGHLAAPILIPAGTKVLMATNRTTVKPHNNEVNVVVTMPDGITKYSSYALAGATTDFNMTWAALYALTVNELPTGSKTVDSGNGCNHCHDPHMSARNTAGELVGFRIIRKSEILQIAAKGLNPYVSGSPKVFDSSQPLDIERGVALCAQCHVEYVCGKSGIDGIDRDYFPWAKVGELETIYKAEFPPQTGQPGPYVMDWSHGTGLLGSPTAPGLYWTPFPIAEPLIKSQHPEAETYWNSRHYANGAPCFLCHMPKVTKTSGGTFTSHWMASPNKYMEATPVQAFAGEFGLTLDADGIIVPCGACHGGFLARMKNKAYQIQDGNYSMALNGQTALMDSLKAIKAAKDAKAAGKNVDMAKLKLATDSHRMAHVRWENLAVSENSMGFHDPAAFSTEMKNVVTYATNAKNYATSAIPRK
ncbi:MAG: hypothetical protein C0418_04895 [Coriobacteriaceae bacterium]|nr:hypothetical protein [Coriobacteriaceae bacterium]